MLGDSTPWMHLYRHAHQGSVPVDAAPEILASSCEKYFLQFQLHDDNLHTLASTGLKGGCEMGNEGLLCEGVFAKTVRLHPADRAKSVEEIIELMAPNDGREGEWYVPK
jgi:hypothetical protein